MVSREKSGLELGLGISNIYKNASGYKLLKLVLKLCLLIKRHRITKHFRVMTEVLIRSGGRSSARSSEECD